MFMSSADVLVSKLVIAHARQVGAVGGKAIKTSKPVLHYEIQLGRVVCPARAAAKDLRSARNMIPIITKLGQLACTAILLIS
jgi:hypothetical protein